MLDAIDSKNVLDLVHYVSISLIPFACFLGEIDPDSSELSPHIASLDTWASRSLSSSSSSSRPAIWPVNSNDDPSKSPIGVRRLPIELTDVCFFNRFTMLIGKWNAYC